MTLRIYDAVAEAQADAAVDSVDAGAAAGRVEIRTGAQPTVNAALSGTLLATFTLGDPAYGAAAASGSGAVASGAGLPIGTTGAATDTAGYGAVLDSDGNIKWTGTVGVGSGDFQLDNLSIATGQTVNLTALSYTQPQT